MNPPDPILPSSPLLDIRDLCVHIPTPGGLARAVDGVDLRLSSGERLGLVGESGCGKSLTARAAIGLLPHGARVTGRVSFDGRDTVSMPEPERRALRGSGIAMVFQDPMTYLNPVFTVGNQIAEALPGSIATSERRVRVVELLRRVRLPEPERAATSYPWQLSGGMRQRALIAMAIAASPRLLIADEPTTALDVTVQAGVLDLLDDLVRETGMSLLLISHDLGVVARVCDRVAVMYAGKIIEEGTAADVLGAPAHPYTRGLLTALRALDAGRVSATIPGQVHPPTNHPPGCRFHPRCRDAIERCRNEEPTMRGIGAGRTAACHLVECAT
ncbi:MAG: ABC transporter ATP-binding protein [Deltaproteobacteria bacterium]|nr:ABC transporter ATP-binding protein [Deltaproteobacteria bacterium]